MAAQVCASLGARIGVGIGELLPLPYRGAYEHMADLQDARSVLYDSRDRA